MRYCWLVLALLAFSSCNMQAGKNHFVLAERLFQDQKYEAAVKEFKKIVEEDPNGKLAEQALFRIGVIQFLYLEDYPEAAKNFSLFSKETDDKKLKYQAEKNIGEIYFVKLEHYPHAIVQYKRLLELFPDAKERDFFYLRLGKSYYGAMKFDEAIKTYRKVVSSYPNSPIAPEALYQIGNTHFTKDDECEEAVGVFTEVLLSYPKSPQSVFAQFGIANCFEIMEMPDKALSIYQKILNKYPLKDVIHAKIQRLKEKSDKKF